MGFPKAIGHPAYGLLIVLDIERFLFGLREREVSRLILSRNIFDSQRLDGGNQFVSFHKRLTEVRKHALKAIFVRDDLIKEVFPLQGNETAYLRQGCIPLGEPVAVCWMRWHSAR